MSGLVRVGWSKLDCFVKLETLVKKVNDKCFQIIEGGQVLYHPIL